MHFLSETHIQRSLILKSQNQTSSINKITSGLVVNYKSYLKLKLYENNLQDLEQQTKVFLPQKMFPKIKIQVSYLAKLVKNINEKEEVLNRRMKSDMFYNFDNVPNFHDTINEAIDDGQLEGSDFQFKKLKKL